MKLYSLKKLFLLLGASSALSAVAYDVHVGDGYYNIDTEQHTAALTYLVRYNATNKSAYVGDLVMPETFEHEGETYTVTSVGLRAFYSCTDLTSIVLPNTITSIESNAFYGCTALKRVVLPAQLTMIKDATFQNCTSLEEVVFPETLQSIGNDAFSYCTSIKKFEFPDECVSLGNQCFYNCTSLEEVEFSPRTTDIGIRAFWSCGKLTSLTLPEGLNKLAVSVFENCTSLQNVYVMSNLTSIDHYAFSACSNLRDIYFPSVLPPQTVQESAFYDTPSTRRIHVDNAQVEAFHRKSVWRAFDEIIPLQCANPRIEIKNGELNIVTDTNLSYSQRNESITYDIQVSDIREGVVAAEEMQDFGELSATYDVRAKAMVDGCEDSEEVTAQVCWIDFRLVSADDEEGGTTAIEGPAAQRPVLVSNRDGEVVISGLPDGERVSFYDISGRLVGASSAVGGQATFSATSGQVIIVKAGNSSFKIRVN